MERLPGVKRFLKTHQNWVQMTLPGLVIAGLVLVLIVPKVRQWYALQQEIGKVGRQMERVSMDLASLPPERLQRLARADADDRERLPGRGRFYTYLGHLRELGRSLGIDEITYFRGAVERVDMDEILARSTFNELPISLDPDSNVLYGIPVKIQFQAPYRTLYRFLRSLRGGKRLTDIREVRVKKKSGSLAVEMKMELYYLVKNSGRKDAA
ncbi:MAG: hypothetical protein GXP58_06045 [Deltaproteobacteria bacterium]|nr:hypothetical protein [Deltaproteobacteria bacterium]